jgi:flagellar basal-body rod protein FlgG
MRALAIAATGMNAQAMNMEVIANNIANINTTGYKRARAEFTDLLYQAEIDAGAPNKTGEGKVPEGAEIGLGTRLAAVRKAHLQGALAPTGNKLDVALNGRGWFQIAGANGEVSYTRAGAFNKNENGQIVTLAGDLVQPTMTIPQDASETIINEDGRVFVRIGNNTELQEIGQFSLVNFINEAGLDPLGGNLFRETPASGAPVAGVAGQPGFGRIYQSHLENSNVDPVKEITELISAQRAYEMNSKVIQAADEMFGTVAKGIR